MELTNGDVKKMRFFSEISEISKTKKSKKLSNTDLTKLKDFQNGIKL